MGWIVVAAPIYAIIGGVLGYFIADESGRSREQWATAGVFFGPFIVIPLVVTGALAGATDAPTAPFWLNVVTFVAGLLVIAAVLGAIGGAVFLVRAL